MRAIESMLPGAGRDDRGGDTRGSLMDDRRIVVAAGAGAVAFVGARYAVLKQIPAIGPVPAAAVTILAGLLLAGWVTRPGTVGALIEGAGIGLVAIGALELAGA